MDFEIIEKLNGFNHVKFEDKRHIYTIGDKQLTSVTTFLKKFEPDKDWNEIATKYGAKHGIHPDEVLANWAEEGRIGGEKGSEFHLYAELAVSSKVYLYDTEKMPKELADMWDEFWEEAKGNLIPVRSEFVMGDEDYGLGGMIDQIFWNVKMQELQIWDWKTNKKIAMSNKYQSFKHPIAYIDECEYNKYSLQLALYKYIIEKNLGLKIGSCYIVHFNTNNDKYKIMKTLDLRKEVERMLIAA
jgi:hypothetical protein